MRVVIFWTMCHLPLGHEKKALLNSNASKTILPNQVYEKSENLCIETQPHSFNKSCLELTGFKVDVLLYYPQKCHTHLEITSSCVPFHSAH